MIEIKTADELADPGLEARWAARRNTPEAEILRAVLREFVDRPGPVAVGDILVALPDQPPMAVRDRLARLDADDLIQLDDDRVEVAYPFSARPTGFIARLTHGHDRFCCCAIDALGIAPMVRQPVLVRAACHQSGSPLELSVTPEGLGSEAGDVMVWVGRRGEGDRRATDFL
jgi:hypothetical protein